MLRFILRKLIYGFLVLLGVVVVVFFLFNNLKVDPARLTLGQRADVATIEQVRKELYLDKPLRVQFFMYLNDISPLGIHKADEQNKYKYIKLLGIDKNVLALKRPYLRQCYQTKRNVSDVLLAALPQTIILAMAAMLLACIVGIMLGVIAAIRQNSWIDNTLIFISNLGISQPSYFSGILLAIFFGYIYSKYTGLNLQGNLFVVDDTGAPDVIWKNLILPAIALGIRPIALIFQLTRSSMLEVLSADYVRTAKAKGLSDFKVVFKHTLRNALNPVVTATSGWFAGMLAGAYFIERIFGYKGLGFETIHALETMNFPVVMGAVLFTSFIFIVINIVVDILYGVLDPRIAVK